MIIGLPSGPVRTPENIGVPFSAIDLKSLIRSSGTNAGHEISPAVTECRTFRLSGAARQICRNSSVLEQDLRSGRIRTRRRCGRQELKSGFYIPIVTFERTRHVLRDQQVALRNVGHEIIICLGMRSNAEDRDGNKRHERYKNK